jgi:hypothetical protein
VEEQILQDQLKPPDQQDFQLQQQLTDQHHQLLLKDEEFHHQRAKKNWATKGDQNTAYFHQAIVKRTRKNRITYLCNPDGSESTTPEQIAATLTTYFKHLFSLQTMPSHTVISNLASSVNADQTGSGDPVTTTTAVQRNDQSAQQQEPPTFTATQPTIHELHQIVKQMRNNASPGPDGLNAAFYKSAWSWIGTDVHKLVTNFILLPSCNLRLIKPLLF